MRVLRPYGRGIPISAFQFISRVLPYLTGCWVWCGIHAFFDSTPVYRSPKTQIFSIMKRFLILLGLTASTALIFGATYATMNRTVQSTSSFHAPTTQSSIHDTTKLKNERVATLQRPWISARLRIATRQWCPRSTNATASTSQEPRFMVSWSTWQPVSLNFCERNGLHARSQNLLNELCQGLPSLCR